MRYYLRHVLPHLTCTWWSTNKNSFSHTHTRTVATQRVPSKPAELPLLSSPVVYLYAGERTPLGLGLLAHSDSRGTTGSWRHHGAHATRASLCEPIRASYGVAMQLVYTRQNTTQNSTRWRGKVGGGDVQRARAFTHTHTLTGEQTGTPRWLATQRRRFNRYRFHNWTPC